MCERPVPPGPLWRIQALKFDRRLHYTLPAYLLRDDGEHLVFLPQPGGQIEHISRNQTIPITRHGDMHFWRERWYNVYIHADLDNGSFSHFYCNMGLPPEIDGDTITFVDLDLDVRIWADGRHEVLDEDEFEEHIALFGYPPDVIQGARQAAEDVLARWRERRSPFDRYGTPPTRSR